MIDTNLDAIDGERDGARFLERLRVEHMDPDELLRQVVLAQGWSPDRLRGFCRALQKTLEQGGCA